MVTCLCIDLERASSLHPHPNGYVKTVAELAQWERQAMC